MDIIWFVVIYIAVALSLFLFCSVDALYYNYIDKEKWIEIVSISLFWPIYALKKIIDIIVKVLYFLFEVLKKLINDIFKI